MKIFSIIFATTLLLITSSCQKEEMKGNPVNESVTIELSATFGTSSKITYTEIENGDLHPEWEIGDEVIGFDQMSNVYTFKVKSIDQNTGIARFDTSNYPGLKDGHRLHLIYKSGAKADVLYNKSLPVSFIFQSGDKNIPAVMIADGTVENNHCLFTFKNVCTIVGFTQASLSDVPSGTAIKQVAVSGSNMSQGTVRLKDGDAMGELEFIGGGEEIESISTGVLNDTYLSSDGTFINGEGEPKPVYIAVPAGAAIKSIDVMPYAFSGVKASNETYHHNLSAAKLAVPGSYLRVRGSTRKYIHLETPYIIAGNKKWSIENLAISESGKNLWKGNLAGDANTGHLNGDYFQWAASYSGYGLEPDKAKPEDLLVYDSFSIQIHDYEGSAEFTFKTGRGFTHQSSPYYDSYAFYGKYTKDIFGGEGDGRDKLEKMDDAASHILGNDWRICTENEIAALLDNMYWAYDFTDYGYYLFEPDDSHQKGKLEPINAMDKNIALMFIPGTGSYSSSFGNGDISIDIWTNTLHDESFAFARSFYNNSHGTFSGAIKFSSRFYGLIIRPVSD